MFLGSFFVARNTSALTHSGNKIFLNITFSGKFSLLELANNATPTDAITNPKNTLGWLTYCTKLGLTPLFTNKDDSVESNKPPEIANINYYYTQWCPYCKKASGEWEATKSKFDGKVINNHKIQFNEIDCDAKENAEQVKDIDGYPTIKIFLPDGKTVEYDSKPDRKTLELFINSVLNE